MQIFFGAITTIGTIWVYFCVPETKGRTLEEMDELFGEAGFAQEDSDRREKIERDIGLHALLNGEETPKEKAAPELKADEAGVSDELVEDGSGARQGA